jgi:hypothetical protein
MIRRNDNDSYTKTVGGRYEAPPKTQVGGLRNMLPEIKLKTSRLLRGNETSQCSMFNDNSMVRLSSYDRKFEQPAIRQSAHFSPREQPYKKSLYSPLGSPNLSAAKIKTCQ